MKKMKSTSEIIPAHCGYCVVGIQPDYEWNVTNWHRCLVYIESSDNLLEHGRKKQMHFHAYVKFD